MVTPVIGRVALPAMAAALALSLGLAGCGGGGGGGNDAVDLTKRLAPGADSYEAVDDAAVKDGLGLPDDADPLDPGRSELSAFVLPTLAGLMAGRPSRRELAALDLGAVTASASSSTDDGSKPLDQVTVLASSADIGVIGSALGDLGFTDRGGILEPHDGSPAVRLDDGTIYVSADAAPLRDLPREPADDLPSSLLGELGGEAVSVLGPTACVDASGSGSSANGTGELAFLVKGGPDPSKVEYEAADGITVGDADVHGDVVGVPFESDRPLSAPDVRATLLPGYDCG